VTPCPHKKKPKKILQEPEKRPKNAVHPRGKPKAVGTRPVQQGGQTLDPAIVIDWRTYHAAIYYISAADTRSLGLGPKKSF